MRTLVALGAWVFLTTVAVVPVTGQPQTAQLSSEPIPTDQPVTGTFSADPVAPEGGDRLLFQPDDPNAVAQSVLVPDYFARITQRMPRLQVQFEETAEGFRVVENSETLPELALSRRNRNLLAHRELAPLRQALNELDTTADYAFTRERMGASSSAVDPIQKKAFETAIKTDMQQFAGDISLPDSEAELVKQIAGEARRSYEAFLQSVPSLLPEERCQLPRGEKARYCNTRRYPLSDYRSMSARSHGVVGVGIDPGTGRTDLHCSGSVIGENLILTARHCTFYSEESPISRGDLRVVFDREQDDPTIGAFKPESVKVSAIISRGRPATDDGEKLDFAILKVVHTPPSRAIYKPARLPVRGRQLCLQTARLPLDEFVYLIGFGRSGERELADHAQVLFPYRIISRERDFLFHDVQLEARNSQLKDDELEQMLRKWYSSYELADDARHFVHKSMLWNRQATVGLGIDAYSGDSGAPVLWRNTHRVHAVFRGGEKDRGSVYVPGWRRHEAGVPVELIVQHMNETQPVWMEEHMVCAYGLKDTHSALWSDDADLVNHCKVICEQ